MQPLTAWNGPLTLLTVPDKELAKTLEVISHEKEKNSGRLAPEEYRNLEAMNLLNSDAQEAKELEGSPKQIKWANDIKAAYKTYMDDLEEVIKKHKDDDFFGRMTSIFMTALK